MMDPITEEVRADRNSDATASMISNEEKKEDNAQEKASKEDTKCKFSSLFDDAQLLQGLCLAAQEVDKSLKRAEVLTDSPRAQGIVSIIFIMKSEDKYSTFLCSHVSHLIVMLMF